MHRRLARTAAVATACCLLAAGCGDDGTSVDAERAKAPAATVLAAAQKATAAVGSFHIEGTARTRDGVRTELAGDVTTAAGGAARMVITTGRGRVEVVQVGRRTYVRGDRAFWAGAEGDAAAAALATRLAGRWVTEPDAGAADGFSAQLARLAPKQFAACLAVGHGTLTNLGARDGDGGEVIVLRDAGDRPGAAPGELRVAANGPARPVRLRQTGPPARGGRLDPRCRSEADRDVVATDYRLSAFGEAVEVTAPAKPLDYDTVVGEVVADIL